ncbi:MAG UNVERIFIED_CONTAM: hypothetical protein LVQ98_03670 [Rickettsiaceae bacterium]
MPSQTTGTATSGFSTVSFDGDEWSPDERSDDDQWSQGEDEDAPIGHSKEVDTMGEGRDGDDNADSLG